MAHTIGRLVVNGANLEGSIRTLKFTLAFCLVQNQEKRGGDSPDYLVVAQSIDGASVEIGAAWKKTKSTPDGDNNYLSMSLSDPDIPDHLGNLAAFQNQNSGTGNEWRIVL